MPLYEGSTADEIWRLAYEGFVSGRIVGRVPDTRTGSTLEMLHVQLVLADPIQRWVLTRFPAINPAFAIVETIWILAGRDDAKFLLPWNSQLRRFVGSDDELYGAYGSRLRKRFGFDQMTEAYEGLSRNPSSRQFVLQLWDPRTDFPFRDGSPRGSDIPCNVCSLLKIRNGKLDWLQVMRSNDLFLGLPYNIVQFTTLQEIMAGWLGVTVGSYVHVSDSLHIYERDLKTLRLCGNIHSPEVRNHDSLRLSKLQFDTVLVKLNGFLEDLSKAEISAKDAFNRLTALDIPAAYRNLTAVVVAELARRHHEPEVTREAMAVCTNEVLKLLWHNWNERVTSKDV